MCKNPFTNQNVCAIIKINTERNDYSANESQKNNI